jgi:hypothetical protein
MGDPLIFTSITGLLPTIRMGTTVAADSTATNSESSEQADNVAERISKAIVDGLIELSMQSPTYERLLRVKLCPS